MKDNNNKIDFEYLVFDNTGELIDEIPLFDLTCVEDAVTYFEEDSLGVISKGTLEYSSEFENVAIFKIEGSENIYLILEEQAENVSDSDLDNIVKAYIK